MTIQIPREEVAIVGPIFEALHAKVFDSRFTAQMTRDNTRISKTALGIKIERVRLKTSKEFCGNHPNACVLGGKDRKGQYLEGADWVEWNELVNDVLDSFNSTATAWSRPVELKDKLFIRKDGERRVHYDSNPVFGGLGLRGYVWLGDEPGAYEDCRGKPSPVTTFPKGTPGIYTKTGYNEVG